MADEATLLVKIKTIIDENVFTKNLKTIGKGVKDSFALKSPASGVAKETGGDEKKGGGLLSGLKGIGKSIGNIVKVAGTALKWLGVIGLVMAAIEPAMKLVGDITIMLKEFFRPISDMLTTLVMPLLMMLRPIVQMFRVLMAPFRELAFQGLAASNMLISQGMQMNMEGQEGGGALIGAGMKGAISSAGLLMSGFLQVLMQPLAGLIDNVIPGTLAGFDSMMEAWQSRAIGGIFKVMGKADLVMKLGEDISILTSDNISALFTVIDTHVDEIRKTVGGFTIETWKDDFSTIQTNLDEFFDPLIESLAAGSPMDEAMINMSKNLKAFESLYPLTASAMDKAVTSLALNFLELKRITDETFNMVGISGLDAKLDEMKGTNFFEKVFDVFIGTRATTGLTSLFTKGDLLGNLKESVSMWENASERKNTLLDNTMNSLGLVTEEERKSWLERNDLAKHYLNPSTGKIIQTHITGYFSMEKSANKFVDALKTAGKSIETIADQAANAARRAEASARSAANRLSNISILRGN